MRRSYHLESGNTLRLVSGILILSSGLHLPKLYNLLGFSITFWLTNVLAWWKQAGGQRCQSVGVLIGRSIIYWNLIWAVLNRWLIDAFSNNQQRLDYHGSTRLHFDFLYAKSMNQDEICSRIFIYLTLCGYVCLPSPTYRYALRLLRFRSHTELKH